MAVTMTMKVTLGRCVIFTFEADDDDNDCIDDDDAWTLETSSSSLLNPNKADGIDSHDDADDIDDT